MAYDYGFADASNKVSRAYRQVGEKLADITGAGSTTAKTAAIERDADAAYNRFTSEEAVKRAEYDRHNSRRDTLAEARMDRNEKQGHYLRPLAVLIILAGIAVAVCGCMFYGGGRIGLAILAWLGAAAAVAVAVLAFFGGVAVGIVVSVVELILAAHWHVFGNPVFKPTGARPAFVFGGIGVAIAAIIIGVAIWLNFDGTHGKKGKEEEAEEEATFAVLHDWQDICNNYVAEFQRLLKKADDLYLASLPEDKRAAEKKHRAEKAEHERNQGILEEMSDAYSWYKPCYADEETFWGVVAKLNRSQVDAAWPSAVRAYGLRTNSHGMPVVNGSFKPATDAKAKESLDALKKVRTPHAAHMHGHPGGGLYKSDFDASSVASGASGERLFAKLLDRDGILNNCESYWSLYRPDTDGKGSGADIDCVLVFGDHIIMVDVKNYKSGLDYHTLIPGKAMFCMDPDSRTVVEEYVHSANMAFAQRNIHGRFQGGGCTVESFVVLMPGPGGEPKLDPDVCWPGNIPAMSYSTFRTMIADRAAKDPGYASYTAPGRDVADYLGGLVKRA